MIEINMYFNKKKNMYNRRFAIFIDISRHFFNDVSDNGQKPQILHVFDVIE